MNITEINEREVSAEVKKLLRIKYALELLSDDPLDFKKIVIDYSYFILFSKKLTGNL